MYTDPSGEFWHLVIGAAIGGTFNVLMNLNNIDNFGEGLAYFGIGAAAGALGAGVGSGVGSLTMGGSFGAGFTGSCIAQTSFIAGAAGGFTAGFINGTGNSLMQGNNFGDALLYGAKSGIVGGVIGGVTSGYNAFRDGRNLWNGSGLSYQDKLASLYQRAIDEGILSPEEDAVGPLGVGKTKGNLALTRSGDKVFYDEYQDFSGTDYKYYKIGYKNNSINFSRKAIRMIWNDPSRNHLELLNHEVIHANDLLKVTWWDDFNLRNDIIFNQRFGNGKYLNYWMEIRAYTINFNNTGWIKFQNMIGVYERMLDNIYR